MTKDPLKASGSAPDAHPGPPSGTLEDARDEGPAASVAHGRGEARGAGGETEAEVAAEAPGAAPDDPPGEAPPVRVHHGRLDRGVAPMHLTPAEALRLAEEGPAGLPRRELPPDVEDAGGSDEPG